MLFYGGFIVIIRNLCKTILGKGDNTVLEVHVLTLCSVYCVVNIVRI